ncbi:FGGY-family carbohydrate kinase [Bacillus pacificus]
MLRNETFEELLNDITNVPIGSNGLLFTPYLVGNAHRMRMLIFVEALLVLDSSHKKRDFVRAIIEGITFSLNESIEIFRESGKNIDAIVSIGGGAKNDTWLQIQADIFNAKIIKLSTEQGPALGAAILAAYGAGWYKSLDECANLFMSLPKHIVLFQKMLDYTPDCIALYKDIYGQTKKLNKGLNEFRKINLLQISTHRTYVYPAIGRQ